MRGDRADERTPNSYQLKVTTGGSDKGCRLPSWRNMKVYILAEEDFDELLAELELSMFRLQKEDEADRAKYAEIHRRFHYLLCLWIERVKK